MLKVSDEEVLALRRESGRVLQQELLQGAAVKSPAAVAARPRIRCEGAPSAVTAGLLGSAGRVYSCDGPHTRMACLHSVTHMRRLWLVS
jgi:hypothetical protein